MKQLNKILLASAVLGLTLTSAQAQTFIDPNIPRPGSPSGTPNGLALLAGFDFDNNSAGTINVGVQRARYSDVFGNSGSNTALTAPGGIFFNGTFGSDSWGSVAKNSTGDANRDILTRSGPGSTFDLGGQTGTEGAANLNNANVGTAAMNEFSILVHSQDTVNSFENIQLELWGRDPANLGGATINWSYSIDGGATKVSTGLSSVFSTNQFAQSLVDFSAISAMDNVLDLAIIGTVVEVAAGVQLNFDNVAVYGTAFAPIPEPSTYAAILGGLALGVAAVRRRKARLAA